MRAEYENLKKSWGGKGGYDAWFSKPINNAKLNTVATYYELVPTFNRLLAQQKGELPAFYAEMRKLAKLPKAERQAILDKFAKSPAPAAVAARTDSASKTPGDVLENAATARR
jgi:predicted aminopeptidase